jgi:hypothetical protein
MRLGKGFLLKIGVVELADVNSAFPKIRVGNPQHP